MSISISGSNSISGLSGNDTNFDKVLEQLKKIESTKLDRLEAWKSDWNLRYEAFNDIIEQIEAASNVLADLSNKNDFVSKNVTSSNENVVTGIANAAARDVQHSITVNQMASTAVWANTGHVFSAKDDIIATEATDFVFEYAGRKHSIRIGRNTTLDSFASIVNNSTDNPGIRVNIVQTGSGYVYQIAGKDTGAENDLIIYSNEDLKGMAASGTNSAWQTDRAADMSAGISAPVTYTYDVTLYDGKQCHITLSGDRTAEDLREALEELRDREGKKAVTATVNAAGDLEIIGVTSFSRRESTEAEYRSPTVWTGVTDLDKKLNEQAIASGMADDATLEFRLTMEDNSERTVAIRADSTLKDLILQIDQTANGLKGITGSGSMSLENRNGFWGTAISGIRDIECVNAVSSSGFSVVPAPSSGQFSASLDATTVLTFGDPLNGSDSIDTSSSGKDITLTFVNSHGDVRSIHLAANATVDDFRNALTDTAALQQALQGMGATVTVNGDSVTFAGIKDIIVTTGSIDRNVFSTSLDRDATSLAVSSDSENLFYMDSSGDMYLEEPPDLVYTVTTNEGLTGTLTMGSGASLNDVVACLRDTSGSGSTRFKGWEWKDAAGNIVTGSLQLTVNVTDAGDGRKFLEILDVQNVNGPGLEGQVASSDNWSIQRACNARYTIDNWPIEMESATNSVSDVIEGVIFSIQDTGTGRLSVSTDIASVEESIQTFLDSVNSVLLTINELMAYDENKEVTSNDPNDIGNDNYSPSGLTSQQGSLLTGNYGVQLLKSRFSSLLTSSPAGFRSMASANDVLAGDVLANLANLGIKTDTDSTSSTYGLLVIAPSSSVAEIQNMDQENYEDMINNHLEAVVDFFCGSGTGTSSSSDFRYGSHVEGITRAGVYEVTYEVDANGDISDVFIGGHRANRDDSQSGNYYSVASGDARGLSILIDDLTTGSHKGEIRIREGMVDTVHNFLKSELTWYDVNVPAGATEQEIADAVALKSKNGALMVLRENYMNVMENIQDSIEKEQYRLGIWEARQKNIFASLESLLASYSEQQKTLESQLAQLDSGK